MKDTILAKIIFEGSVETVSVHYQTVLLGAPRITDVRLGQRSIFSTVRDDLLMMKRLRSRVMQVLGKRSYADYMNDMLSQLTEMD